MIFSPSSTHPYYELIPRGEMPGARVLEISTRSSEGLGRRLSAMNLQAASGRGTVEAIYQGSKDFGDGPNPEIAAAPNGFAAKALARARASGKRLIGFRLAGRDWPASTGTAAYDWLWCSAALAELGGDALADLGRWDGFTDMFWRSGGVTACQARSAAILVSLLRRGGDGMPPELDSEEEWIRCHRTANGRACRVVSKRSPGDGRRGVYIGRPGRLGNPYRIGRDGDRAAVIRRFRDHLVRSVDAGAPGFGINALATLAGQALVCWCAPLACHGDVLAAAAEWAHRGGLRGEAWWRTARVDGDGRLEHPDGRRR